MRGWNSCGDPVGVQVAVEGLEARRLFASIVLFGGVLEVRGDGNASNHITVRNSADDLNVEVTVMTVNRRGQSNTISNTFPKAQGINGVAIRGGSLADGITVDEVAGLEFEIAVRVDAGGGIDTVRTGSGIDLINAGGGDDNVTSGAGADVVRGQGGHDVIDAGLGVDRVNGNAGNDIIYGREDNDFLRGGGGNDRLFGATGDDQLFGEAGVDQLYGEEGNDHLYGAAGNDFIFGASGDDVLGAVPGIDTIQGGDGRDRFIVSELLRNGETDYDPLLGDILVVSRTEGGTPPAI